MTGQANLRGLAPLVVVEGPLAREYPAGTLYNHPRSRSGVLRRPGPIPPGLAEAAD